MFRWLSIRDPNIYLSVVVAFVLAALAAITRGGEKDGKELFRAFEQGSVEAAIDTATQRLHACETDKTQGAAELGDACADLALLYDYTGDYVRAEPLYVRALQIQEKTLGPESWEPRATLRNLFALYANTGGYAKAEKILRREPHLQEEITRPMGMAATSLGWSRRGIDWRHARFILAQGWNSYSHGEIETALDRAKSAVEISRRIDAKPSLSDALNLWATVYYKRGEYDSALKIYTESLSVSTSSNYHFGKARNWSSIGSTCYRQGDYRQALDNYEKSLAARRQLGNKDEIGRALNDLANVHQEMGAYQRALELRQEAFRLWEETKNQPGMADVLNDIAWVYESMGDSAKALEYLGRARDIHQQVSDLWGVADDTDGFGLVSFKTGQYEQALEMFRDSLQRFAQLGNREEQARVECHLGETLHQLNRLSEAEAAFQTGLSLYEKLFGSESPRIADALNNLALIAIDSDQKSRAIDLAQRRDGVSETLLANVLTFTSEQQRLEFQKTTDPYSLLASLDCGPLLAKTLLRNKGIVLDSLLEDRLVAEASADPKQREAVTELRSAKQRLMKLQLETPPDMSEEAINKWKQQKEQLSRRIEELEAQLARQIAGLGRARRALSVTVPQVQATLGKSDVLVELLRYRHYLGKNKFEPRYGAVVISPKGEPMWVPLGDADKVDKSVQLYQKSARGQTDEPTLSNVLHALHEQIWSPIGKILPPETRTVIVSPDGDLHFVSFATLVGSDDKFVGEKYSVRYVASGRDLLREFKAANNSQASVYANPDFGSQQSSLGTNRGTSVALRSIEMRDLQNISLPPLPGTEAEATALHKRFGNSAKVFLGGDATKAQLQQVNSPHILHLATHGFFLPEIELALSEDPLHRNGDIPKDKLVNPMHRSGLALAGAQTTLQAWARGEVPPIENNGIVTAEDVGGLKLNGTWLVVLSACETGSGEARAGEGVMGLRRGFIQAGAQNLLMTLWPISDQTTVDIMIDFYDAADKTKNAPQALADVQRGWLVKLRKERGLLDAVRLAGPFIMSSQGKN